MASKKAAGSTKKRRGVKAFGGQKITPGTIIIRQKGTKVHPGNNVGMGRDFTIFAKVAGEVKFERMDKRRLKVSVYPVTANGAA